MNGGWFEIVLVAAGIVLFLTLVGLVVFALLRQQRLEMERAQARQAELLRRAEQAVAAEAKIVSVRVAMPAEEMVSVASVTLRLQVYPSQETPYLASAIWLVELPALSDLQAESNVAVKIDREDAHIIYPNIQGARYVGKL